MLEKYLNILCCPDCENDLLINNSELTCTGCKRNFAIDDGIPILMPSSVLKEQKKAIEVWGEEYREMIDKKEFKYLDKYCEADTKLIKDRARNKEVSFLEIGCGRARNCTALLKDGYQNIIGLDISLDALKLAKKICEYNGILNYFFVVGDIYKMPFKKNSFDLVFGGGSLEHFEDTLGGFKKINKVLRKDGELIATVPYASLSTLIQGFLTGNTPKIPLIKNFYKFFHKYIARNKNLMFGFEYSFLIGDLENIARKAGFKNFNASLYDVNYDLKFIPNFMKSFFLKIIRMRILWPMITIKAKKK